MQDLNQIHFKNSETFRSWLEGNFDTSMGVWLIFSKKHMKAECITYGEALDEALCYGWIDSIVRRVDDEKYIQKFSPRKNTSNWSDVNKIKVLALIKQGKMTEVGLQKIDTYIKTGKLDWKLKELQEKKKSKIELPDFILKEFAKNEPALTNFNELAPSYKRQYIGWITEAKREETKLKRLKVSVQRLKENKKLWMK